MKVKTNWVPSAFTMANMFCGYFSVISAANGKITQAAWLIVAAAILDALDGKVARFAKAASNFGVEYDSLADVVSFGFAPSYLAYRAVFNSWGTVGLLLSFAPLVFGSIRLARFNVRLKGFDKAYFEGLPIPAAAVTIATFLVFNIQFWEYLRWVKVFLLLILLVSVLMISNIRYETLPNFSLQRGTPQKGKIFTVLIGTILIILFPQEAFFPLAITYVFSGPVVILWRLFFSKSTPDTQEKHKGNRKNESHRQGSSQERHS